MSGLLVSYLVGYLIRKTALAYANACKPFVCNLCLQAMGIVLDLGRNDEMVGGQQGEISSSSSRVKVLVVPTDEELAIAKETLEVVARIKANARGYVPAAA
jgi:hypothetical protein